MSNCTVCGKVPESAFYYTMRNTVYCASHKSLIRCALCGAGGADGSRGWQQMSPLMLRCPSCAVGAVETKAALRAQVPSVRSGLRTLGLELEGRVQINLADSSELVSTCRVNNGNLLGVTSLVPDLSGQALMASHILVLRGLPPLWFGSTAAHENMHAWLAEHGIRTPRPEIEEGLCEVVAYGWLGLQTDPLAALLRGHMKTSTDPIYGAGLREVQVLVRRYGLREVLEVLQKTGDVPQ